MNWLLLCNSALTINLLKDYFIVVLYLYNKLFIKIYTIIYYNEIIKNVKIVIIKNVIFFHSTVLHALKRQITSGLCNASDLYTYIAASACYKTAAQGSIPTSLLSLNQYLVEDCFEFALWLQFTRQYSRIYSL